MKRGIRKLIAVLAIVCMITVSISAAFAGSLKDGWKWLWKTAWEEVKLAGQAIADTADYVFTSDDADTAYKSTKKQADKVVHAASMTADSAERVIKDAGDIKEGAKKMIEGTQEIYQGLQDEDPKKLMEEGLNGVQGERTKKGMQKFSEGYRQADNGLIDDALDMLPGTGKVSTLYKTVKTVLEEETGYITKEEAAGRLQEIAEKAVEKLITGGLTDLIPNDTVKKTVKEAKRIAEKMIKGEEINPVEEIFEVVT